MLEDVPPNVQHCSSAVRIGCFYLNVDNFDILAAGGYLQWLGSLESEQVAAEF